MEKVLHVATFVVSSILSQRGELAPEENRMDPEPCTIHDIRLIPENQCNNIIVHRDHVHVSGEVLLNTIREDLPKTFVIGKKLNVTFAEADDRKESFEKLFNPALRGVSITHDWEDDLLASSAYAAYSDTTGNKNFLDDQMPEYHKLPPTIRQAWRSAVRRVRDLVLLQSPSMETPGSNDSNINTVKPTVIYPDPHAPAFKDNEKTGTGNPATEPPHHPKLAWPITTETGFNPYEKYRGLFPENTGLRDTPVPMTDKEIDAIIHPSRITTGNDDTDIPQTASMKAAYRRHTGEDWYDRYPKPQSPTADAELEDAEHYLTDPRGIPPEPNADTADSRDETPKSVDQHERQETAADWDKIKSNKHIKRGEPRDSN